MPRVALHTLGCRLNYADTGALARAFEERGFDVVPFGEPATVTVINTCSVTAEADRKCRQVIRRALAANPETFMVVTGCYAQLRPDDIASIDGVDLVLGTHERPQLLRYADSFVKRERTQVEVSCIDHVGFAPAFAASDRTRAFMKVQDGCDYSCSFCTIPKARGRSRSGTIDALVADATEIAASGFSEIVLSGVNIGLFGADTGQSLPDLVRALDRVEGIARYRISSIEPNLLTDEIIDLVIASRAFQPHFHVPLQSGDDDVLGAMQRRYQTRVFADRVERIRSCAPHAGIGADVIVGFPAETPERFMRSIRFVEQLPLSYLHVFTYSERPGTTAPDRHGERIVPRPERSRRNAVMRLLSEKKKDEFARSHIGTTRPVLWESRDPSGRIEGFTDNYIRVRCSALEVRRGEISESRLLRLDSDGLVDATLD